MTLTSVTRADARSILRPSLLVQWSNGHVSASWPTGTVFPVLLLGTAVRQAAL